MTQELEKAKKVLNKTFCFMQRQADDAKARGEELMEKEDIEFLLSLNDITKEKVLTFESETEYTYDSKKLFRAIHKARNERLKGVRIMCATLTKEDEAKVKERGFFIEYTGHGSTSWDEIYFSEEAFIKQRIASFKNLFGGLASVASMI